MQELAYSIMKGISGGCYCYCFKYPIRAVDELNPAKLIGEKSDIDVCSEECCQEGGKILGYHGFHSCNNYTITEIKASADFLRRVTKLDSIVGDMDWSSLF